MNFDTYDPTASQGIDSMKCPDPECGKKWTARYVIENGVGGYEDDTACPECGEEGEVHDEE